MITKDQALTENEFHENLCKKVVGPRGGVKITQYIHRRNGRTQVWKTRPDEFRIPVKFGLRGTGYITHNNADMFHIPSECPLRDDEDDQA